VLNHPGNEHAFAEAELFDHRPRDEGIGPFTIEIGRRIAEEPVAVGVHLENARASRQRQIVAVGAVEFAALVLILGPPALLTAAVLAPLALTAAVAIALVAAPLASASALAAIIVLSSAISTARPLLLTHARENPKS
jgi:hypothetical protein